MTNKSSNLEADLEATDPVHLLQDQVTEMEKSLTHLHSVMGAHIDALDKELVKGENVKPVKTRSHLLKAAASPLSAGGIFSDFVRALGKFSSDGGQSAGGADAASGGGSSNMSQGQIWAQIAGAVSRASSRYL